MSLDLTRRRLLGVVTTGLPLGVAGCLSSGRRERFDGTLSATTAHQYSSTGCRCCERYASYLQSSLDVTLSRTTPGDLVGIKRRHGVPADFESCHTVVLDEYVVEGHVPVAAIARLLEEEPAIDGIALPGMPAGSPGMGGTKQGPFTVYALGGDRTREVFGEY